MPEAPPVTGPGGDPLTVTWQTHTGGGWYSSPACHGELELQFIRRGRGHYFVDGRPLAFAPNRLLVIPPGVVHYARASGAPWRFEKCCVMMSVEPFAELLQATRFLEGLPVTLDLRPADALTAHFLLLRLAEEYQRRDLFRTDLLLAYMRSLLLLIKRCSLTPAVPPPRHPLVSKAVSFIDGHYREGFTVADLARRMGYSADYLSWLFKRDLGMGLKQYILQRRITEAQMLLATQPELTQAAVAHEVGFRHFGLYNRAFKRFMGLTPETYRGISHRAPGK